MKKVIALLLIVICSGCFFNPTKTLNCKVVNKAQDSEVINNYSFVYKKDEIKEVIINQAYNCKKENSERLYDFNIKKYQQLEEKNTNFNIEYNNEECVINISINDIKNNYKILNELNLDFLRNVTLDELKDSLKNTDFKCK